MSKELINFYNKEVDELSTTVKKNNNKLQDIHDQNNKVKEKRNNLCGRMIYYGLIAISSIIPFTFAGESIVALILGLGFITTGLVSTIVGFNKKKKLEKIITTNDYVINQIEEQNDTLRTEISKRYNRISEIAKQNSEKEQASKRYAFASKTNAIEITK